MFISWVGQNPFFSCICFKWIQQFCWTQSELLTWVFCYRRDKCPVSFSTDTVKKQSKYLGLSASERSESEDKKTSVSFQAAPLIQEPESTAVLSSAISKQPFIIPARGIRWRAGAYKLLLLDHGQLSYAKQGRLGGVLVFKHLLATEQVNIFTRNMTQKNWANQDSWGMSRLKLVKSYTFESHCKITAHFSLIKVLTCQEWYYAMAAFPNSQ